MCKFLFQKKHTIIKTFFFFILMMVFSMASAQNSTGVDEFIEKGKSHNQLEALEYAKKAYQTAIKNGDKIQIAKSTSYLAEVLTDFQVYDEALKYIEIAEQNCPKNEIFLWGEIYLTKSSIYLMLGFYDKALETTYQAENRFKRINTVESSIKIFGVYQNRAFIFSELSDGKDSVSFYDRKSEKLLLSVPEKDAKSRLSLLYFTKSQSLLDSGKIDSARFYTQIALDLKKKYNDKEIILEYITLGDVYYEEGNNQEAISYYLKAIDNSENSKTYFKNDFIDLYKDVAEIYKTEGNLIKEKEYLKKYIDQKNKFNKNQKKSLDYALKEILNKKEETHISQNKKILIAISVIAAILLASFLIYKKRKAKKQLALIDELSEKDEKVYELEQKVNESFEEIVQLAKTNSPEFLTRFQEIYPEFTPKLKEIYPEISSDDIRFCALLKLNFSTKDIAEYTFVTVRSVQTRKSRLRKKFNIPSDEDIYLWINALG